MPEDRTYLDHLLQGRAALVTEIDRLTAAKTELDSLIARIADRPQPSTTKPVASQAAPGATAGAFRPVTSTRRRSTGTRRKSIDKTEKSIRVRVLELLEAEDRDFGLAEIIGRIREAGVQAHDDAVRSITVKLMKDGSVERVGRGHYRLARGSNPAPGAAVAAEAANGPASYPPPLNLAQPWDGQRT
jgi:hypothetical protein